MKLLATSSSKEGIIKLIHNYFCSNGIELQNDNENQWSLIDQKGRLLNFKVILKKKRYRFVILPEESL